MNFQFASPPPFGPPPDAGVGAPVPPGPMPGPGGIPGATGFPPPPFPMPPHPGDMKYTTETQADGTVLLRLLNPNGTPGPVVQIVKPPGMKQGGGK